MSGVGLYLLDSDEEPGAEVYSAATKRDQARLSHGEAVRMVKASPELARRIRVFRDNLSVTQTHSKFEPLGRDADTMDGLNIHGALVDELHAHPTRDVWDVLDTATGSRRQPLLYAITTAGSDRTIICGEQGDYARAVLEGRIEDDTFCAFIYTLDEGDDWEDEGVWPKANPNLGVSVKLEDLRRKAKKAREIPAALNAFLSAPGQVAGAAKYTNGLKARKNHRPAPPRSPRAAVPERSHPNCRRPTTWALGLFSCRYTISRDAILRDSAPALVLSGALGPFRPRVRLDIILEQVRPIQVPGALNWTCADEEVDHGQPA